jgi:hypothetical protein
MHKHKWAIPLFVGVLVAHFWFLEEVIEDAHAQAAEHQ